MGENNHSLLFIPDITGFTNFVKQTEIEHSQHIISELLELIIDSNIMGMEVAEVEGDAVLFFKHNSVPEPDEIIRQVKKTFLDFHNHLRSYESKRICSCGACSTAINLSLKFIIHIGKIGFTSVKDKKKPFGADLILVHRLLKNNVPEKEYLLLTDSFQSNGYRIGPTGNEAWLEYKEGTVSYEHMGEVVYYYAPLQPLHQWVEDPPPPPLQKKVKNPITDRIFIKIPVETVFEKLTNFNYRLEWNKGVEKLEYEKNRVNRIGTRHRCVIGRNQILNFETTSNHFGEGKMVYGENILDLPAAKQAAFYYILATQNGGTMVSAEIHIHPKPVIGWIMLPVLKSKFRKNIRTLLVRLKEVCEKTNHHMMVAG